MEQMPRISFADWLVESIRLTVFPALDATFRSPDHWWQLATGTEPDQVTASTKKGLRSIEGAFHGAKLVLRSALDRIDWFLVPADATVEAAMLNSEPPVFGN